MIAETVKNIIATIRAEGEVALRRLGAEFGDLPAVDAPLLLRPPAFERAFFSLPLEQQQLLQRTAARIRQFAVEQRRCFCELDTEICGGRAGHKLFPVARVACYAPGGRYPLPSSVLMTVIPARVTGVSSVIVASPRPTPLMLAAAHIAGADEFLCVGGAQAVAALAYGAGEVRPCDMIVGPGNAFVTEAKRQVFGAVGIDMLAGPSELLVIADSSADAATIAADLLAQAEHDTEARPMLLTTDVDLCAKVEQELVRQLETLPAAETARAALRNGFLRVVPDLQTAVQESDSVAPEHLQLMVEDPQALLLQLKNYGAVFIAAGTAEVFGDYGAGPNHVLPTGGSARFSSPLSVFTFLRTSTWLKIESAAEIASDAAALARLEGLEAHARAAEKRN